MVGASIGQPVNERGIAVIGEDDWLVRREHSIECVICNAVRMLTGCLQRHEVDDVDDAQPERRKRLAYDHHGGKCFHGRHVTGGGDDRIGIAFIIGGPFPDAEPGSVQPPRPRPTTATAAVCLRRSR